MMEDLILALQILSKYENLSYPTHCEHDVLWVIIDPELVGPEDTEALDGLGFFADERDGCFKSYKYGSA